MGLVIIHLDVSLYFIYLFVFYVFISSRNEFISKWLTLSLWVLFPFRIRHTRKRVNVIDFNDREYPIAQFRIYELFFLIISFLLIFNLTPGFQLPLRKIDFFFFLITFCLCFCYTYAVANELKLFVCTRIHKGGIGMQK